jgi:hypothetical protein
VSPWALLAALGAAVVALGGAYWQGRTDGENKCEANHARDLQVETRAADAAASAVAVGLSKIEVRNVTVTKKLEREVLTREVFRDCRSGPDAVRLLNSTAGVAAAASDAARGGELPASGAAR